MNTVLIVGISAALLLAVGLVVIFRRALSASGVAVPDESWIAAFDSSRYRPMQRLLRDSDLEFLSGQPGFEATMGRRLRAERRRIFREYLKLMRRDFERFYAVAKLMIVHSEEDRSEFAAALLRQRIAFLYAIASIELRLALHMTGARIDVASLVGSLENLRFQVRQLSPSAA